MSTASRLCIFNSHPRLHPACSPPSHTSILKTSPPLLTSSLFPPPLRVVPTLCLSLSRQRSPQPPASDLHGRSHHLISLRPRPRPPKRRAAGARGPYSRTAASQLAYLTYSWPTVLWPTLVLAHLILYAHRTEPPNHGTTTKAPKASNPYSAGTGARPRTRAHHFLSFSAPPPYLGRRLVSNTFSATTPHITFRRPSRRFTLHINQSHFRYIFGRGRIRLWSSPSFHSLRFTSRRRFRPQGSPQQLCTNKTCARSTSDALSKTRNNDDPAVTTQTPKHSNSSRCCNPLIQTQT